MTKRVLFLTGTRADYGKMKPLILKAASIEGVETSVAVTGMHSLSLYGSTWKEVKKDFPDIYLFHNQNIKDSSATILGKTVSRLEDLCQELAPDLLVVHGDRIETLAAAATGALMNIRVGHIEGGEVSGTVDESIRHAVSKLAHIHFVSNEVAAKRLRNMGEPPESIFVIGSPELDLADSPELPSLDEVKDYYGIPPGPHAVFAFHPVTTNADESANHARMVLQALKSVRQHVIAIEPNNDFGSEAIRSALENLRNTIGFSVFPSLRYERFLVLLKNASFVIGNSSMGVREAPHYGVPSIDVGSRQRNRATGPTILSITPTSPLDVTRAIMRALELPRTRSSLFGDGTSAEQFGSLLGNEAIWDIPLQKQLVDE